MKKMKLIALIIVIMITNVIIATTHDLYDPDDPTGNVSLINDISVTITNEIEDFSNTSYLNHHILTFTIDNNHPNGFVIEISSTNSGKFINDTLNQSGVTGKGSEVNYTLTSLHNSEDDEVGGENPTYWGATASLPNHADFTLLNASLTNPITLTFSNSTHPITQATRNFKYRVLLSSGINKSLFSGQLADQITFSITSIE